MKPFNCNLSLFIFFFFFIIGESQTQDYENVVLFQKSKTIKRTIFKKGKKVKISCRICEEPIILGKLKGKKETNIYLEPFNTLNKKEINSAILKVPINTIQSIEYCSRFKDSKGGKTLNKFGNVLLIISSIGVFSSWFPQHVIPEAQGANQPLNKLSIIGFGIGLGISITTAKRKFTIGKWQIVK